MFVRGFDTGAWLVYRPRSYLTVNPCTIDHVNKNVRHESCAPGE